MKNAIKISIMSGLVTAGVLLCGLPHAMAESVPQNNETYYSVNVPSEISLSPDQDETTFTVSGNTYQKRWLDIDITSKNNFNLKNGQVSIPYKLDKTKFEYEPQYVDKDSDSFSESIKVSKNESDVKYSGNYQDQLQFTMNPIETRTIQLDCNGGTVNGKDKVAYTVKNGSSYGQLPVPVRSGYQFVAWKDDKGNTIYSGSKVEADTEKLSCVWSKVIEFYAKSYVNGQFNNNYFKNCGSATLYVNGEKFTDNPNFLYCGSLKTGDTFKLDNISAQDGYVYTGLRIGVGTDFKYEYYENGLVKSISGQVKEDNIGIYCCFESDNVLQNLIRQYNIQEIDVDSTPPSTSVTSIGSTNLFASKDDCYVIDNTLHIYNPEGGKVVAPVNSNRLFGDLTITNLDLKGLDTTQVENAESMFENDYYLTKLNISGFNTSKMKSIKSMFEKCTNLPSIDISHFDTSNVETMESLFYCCEKAKTLNVSGISTSKVTTMTAMFSGCKSVQSIDFSSFDTTNVTSFYNMFADCRSVSIFDLSCFKTTNIKDIRWMFAYTSPQKIKGLETWDLPKVTSLRCTFYRATMSELHLPKLYNVDDMNNAFSFNPNLKTIDLSTIGFRNKIDWTEAFRHCTSLSKINVSKDYTSTNVQTENTFNDCTSLVGGSGTKYDPTFIDSTGARIDGGSSNPGYFTAISQKPIETGSVVNIEGSDYIVMGQTKDGNYRLISGTSVGSKQYQPNQDSSGNYYNIGQYNASDEQDKRYDGQDSNTYEDSYIDKFLENTWYTSLSFQMQSAIVATQINQSAYKEIGHGANCELLLDTDKAATDGSDWYYNEGTIENPKWVVYYKHEWTETDEGIFPLKVWYKQDTGYSGQKYNTITRHVYLPNVEEISNLVNLNDANKTYAFTRGTKGNATHVWLRDNSAYSSRWALGISRTYKSLCRHYVSSAWFDVRPSFIIDLSKIDYTVTGTVNYK